MLRDGSCNSVFAFDKESIQCTYFFSQISLFTTFISKKSLKENCKRRAQLSQRVYMSTVCQPYHSDNKYTFLGQLKMLLYINFPLQNFTKQQNSQFNMPVCCELKGTIHNNIVTVMIT